MNAVEEREEKRFSSDFSHGDNELGHRREEEKVSVYKSMKPFKGRSSSSSSSSSSLLFFSSSNSVPELAGNQKGVETTEEKRKSRAVEEGAGAGAGYRKALREGATP